MSALQTSISKTKTITKTIYLQLCTCLAMQTDFSPDVTLNSFQGQGSKTVRRIAHQHICAKKVIKGFYFTYGIEVYSRHQTISLKQHQGSQIGVTPAHYYTVILARIIKENDIEKGKEEKIWRGQGEDQGKDLSYLQQN